MKSVIFLTSLGIFLSACGMNNYAHNALERENIIVESHESFPHCYAYGCAQRTTIIFTQKDWRPIKALFRPPVQSAASERERIAQAIAIFEQKAGAQSGTHADKSGTFAEMFANSNQHDCVDESLNTTIYLQLLNNTGLLRYHTPGNPVVRLPLIHSGGWPHQSASIKDKDTEIIYAVDSWFHDNGFAAEIIPLENWKDGWKPVTIYQNHKPDINIE